MATKTVDGGITPQLSTEALADLLVSFERSLTAERPERVVLADDSDASLAAALVAAKLLIPLEAMPAATETASANATVIAQLATAYTAPG